MKRFCFAILRSVVSQLLIYSVELSDLFRMKLLSNEKKNLQNQNQFFHINVLIIWFVLTLLVQTSELNKDSSNVKQRNFYQKKTPISLIEIVLNCNQKTPKMKLKGNNFEPMRVPFHIKVILLLGILVAVPIIIMYSRSMRYFDSKNRELFDSIDIFDQTWFKSRAKRSIEAKECLQVEKQTNNQHRFEDLMTSSVKPKPDSTIFFHVTSCPKDGLIALTTR